MKTFDILLVEDDEDMLVFLHNSLMRAGYNVISVENAESALCELSKENFKILITDIKLPGIDGISFVKSLPESVTKDISIIFITGFNAYEADAKSLFPENTTLHKPFHLKSLISKIDEIYSKKHDFAINDDGDDIV